MKNITLQLQKRFETTSIFKNYATISVLHEYCFYFNYFAFIKVLVQLLSYSVLSLDGKKKKKNVIK